MRHKSILLKRNYSQNNIVVPFDSDVELCVQIDWFKPKEVWFVYNTLVLKVLPQSLIHQTSNIVVNFVQLFLVMNTLRVGIFRYLMISYILINNELVNVMLIWNLVIL